MRRPPARPRKQLSSARTYCDSADMCSSRRCAPTWQSTMRCRLERTRDHSPLAPGSIRVPSSAGRVNRFSCGSIASERRISPPVSRSLTCTQPVLPSWMTSGTIDVWPPLPVTSAKIGGNTASKSQGSCEGTDGPDQLAGIPVQGDHRFGPAIVARPGLGIEVGRGITDRRSRTTGTDGDSFRRFKVMTGVRRRRSN
jgi:hypothetical protein